MISGRLGFSQHVFYFALSPVRICVVKLFYSLVRLELELGRMRLGHFGLTFLQGRTFRPCQSNIQKQCLVLCGKAFICQAKYNISLHCKTTIYLGRGFWYVQFARYSSQFHNPNPNPNHKTYPSRNSIITLTTVYA